MNQSGNLHQAFIDELRDTYDAETQLTRALPKLAKAAQNPTLRELFETQLHETRGQITRLERVFESLDEAAQGKHCAGMAGIIEEGRTVTDEHLDQKALDARLIAASQRAEHYEMAAYGTLIAWARAMGHDEAVSLLKQSLDEVKSADETLSKLAEGGINRTAAGADYQEHGDMLEGTFGLEGTRDGDVRRGGPLQQARASEHDDRGDVQRTMAPEFDENTEMVTDQEPDSRTHAGGTRRQRPG